MRVIQPGEELRSGNLPSAGLVLRNARHLSRNATSLCPPVEVRQSPLHGRGLFATAALPAGTEPVSCPVVMGHLANYTFVHTQLSHQMGVNVPVVSLGLCSLINHACSEGRANARCWGVAGVGVIIGVCNLSFGGGG